MKKSELILVRVLAVSDLHQSAMHYAALERAVREHKPQAVFVLGDFLDFSSQTIAKLPAGQCAEILSALVTEHLLLVRGNHEDENLTEFILAWPHNLRPLNAVGGGSYQVGPLTTIGFPCQLGSDLAWCSHTSSDGNTLEISPTHGPKHSLGNYETWLPRLLKNTGPAGRTLWLAHERPAGLPLATDPNFDLQEAVKNYLPALVLSGHDHSTPQRSGTWRAFIGDTCCINVGQSAEELHFTLLDFEFSSRRPSIPTQIIIRAWPWGESFTLKFGRHTRIWKSQLNEPQLPNETNQ